MVLVQTSSRIPNLMKKQFIWFILMILPLKNKRSIKESKKLTTKAKHEQKNCKDNNDQSSKFVLTKYSMDRWQLWEIDGVNGRKEILWYHKPTGKRVSLNKKLKECIKSMSNTVYRCNINQLIILLYYTHIPSC